MSKTVENEYRPNYAVPPGQTLLETLERIGMTQAELAERMGRPRKTVNEIIKGKTSLTAETALQLERVLRIPASFWGNYERHYREALARLEEEGRLAEQTGWLKEVPVTAMIRLGWIRPYEEGVEQLREVLGFFGVASPREWRKKWLVEQQVAFRRSAAFRSDPGAVAAWLRKGEIDAHGIDCGRYDGEEFKKGLRDIRALTPRPEEVFPTGMVRLCAQSGVAVAFVPELPGTRVFGATRWLTPDKALIQLSFRYKRDDQLWFSFFHEAAHILLHRKGDVFIEEEDGEGDKIEKQANDFAANLLISPTKFRQFLRSHMDGKYSKSAIVAFAKEIGVAPGIVVGRLQHDRKLPYTHCNDLKRSLTWVKQEPGVSN